MTDDELNVIEARAKAATPGPWTWIEKLGCFYELQTPDRANGQLVVHSREDILALIAEVRRLRGILDDDANDYRIQRGRFRQSRGE